MDPLPIFPHDSAAMPDVTRQPIPIQKDKESASDGDDDSIFSSDTDASFSSQPKDRNLSHLTSTSSEVVNTNDCDENNMKPKEDSRLREDTSDDKNIHYLKYPRPPSLQSQPSTTKSPVESVSKKKKKRKKKEKSPSECKRPSMDEESKSVSEALKLIGEVVDQTRGNDCDSYTTKARQGAIGHRPPPYGGGKPGASILKQKIDDSGEETASFLNAETYQWEIDKNNKDDTRAESRINRKRNSTEGIKPVGPFNDNTKVSSQGTSKGIKREKKRETKKEYGPVTDELHSKPPTVDIKPKIKAKEEKMDVGKIKKEGRMRGGGEQKIKKEGLLRVGREQVNIDGVRDGGGFDKMLSGGNMKGGEVTMPNAEMLGNVEGKDIDQILIEDELEIYLEDQGDIREDESLPKGMPIEALTTKEEHNTLTSNCQSKVIKDGDYCPPSMPRAFLNCLIAFFLFFVVMESCTVFQIFLDGVIVRDAKYSDSCDDDHQWSYHNIFAKN